MRLPAVLAFGSVLSGLALAESLTPFGDFETGVVGNRPPEFWHRAGGDYLSAYPDWVITQEHKVSGVNSITTTTPREFVMCGETQGGWLTGSVQLRADKPGTKVVVRLSWWDRSIRADETKTVEVGTEWQRVELRTEAMRGQPAELGVRLEKDGARIWVDDIAIDGVPVQNQSVETLTVDGRPVTRAIASLRPEPIDLGRVQGYDGAGQDTSGRVSLSVEIPANCVEFPCVSGGVPLPIGRLFRREHARVVDGNGVEVAAQLDVLARWPADSSIMLLLVTVPTSAASQQFVLEFGAGVSPAAVPGPLGVEVAQSEIRLSGTKRSAPVGLDAVRFTMVTAGGEEYVGTPSAARVELAGPLRAVVRIDGEQKRSDGKRCGRYVTRCTFWRDSRSVHVSHCWIHDEPGPSVPVRSASIDLGGLGRPVTAADAVAQRSIRGLPDPAEYKRQTENLADVFAVRDFWQNHPMALGPTARISLWPGPDFGTRGVLIPQGFARQWDVLVDTPLKRPYQTEAMPILRADPEWMCASGVFEFLLPPDAASFPIFEKRVGNIPTLGSFAKASKESRDLYGVFNYGDIPGDGGWANLESMADHELFIHWMRQNSREHVDAARLAAEHYRDMDVNHAAGFCHTHCNNHVASEEGWSHAWMQGVRDLYFLFGDLRALEVLQEFGTRVLTKPIGWTSGRDWTRPIDDLVDVYQATGDARYLDCAKAHIAELERRQVPENAVCGAERTSWYEDRYGAGCAFTWYGCQAMAKLHALTGAADVLRVLKREIDLSIDVQTKSRRAQNILPGETLSEDHQAAELGTYALGRGSTLFPPLGYLAEKTGERRYLDLGMKVLAHYMLSLRGGSDASATAYATVFLNYAKKAGLRATEEAAAFQRARDFSYERWPKGVANGGFEADSFQHWSVKRVPGQDFFYDDLVKVGYYLDGKVFRSGARALRLHSDNRTRHMSVTGSFALEPRHRYHASVWVKADATMNPSASISLREYDTDSGSGASVRATGRTENEWKEYVSDFCCVERTVATVSLANAGGTGDAWFDDVTIVDEGRLYNLFTGNGLGRDWDRKPPYPGITVATGGSYLPDTQMSTDTEPEGTPVPFAAGCLTDGVAKYDHLQKPRGSYAYWQGRDVGSIRFELGREIKVRSVKINVLIDEGRHSHGVRRIELHSGAADGPVLGVIEPAVDGWNEFKDLDAGLRQLTLVLTKLEGRTYLTLSEVEVWGQDYVE